MIEDTLKQIAESTRAPSHRTLKGLSGLGRADLGTFKEGWARLSTARRRTVARAMLNMAEDDVELDYSDLWPLLLDDPDAQVRAAAADGLWESNDEHMLPPLLSLLKSDPAPEVRAAVAETLGHFAALAESGKLHGDNAQKLRTALLDTYRTVEDDKNTTEVRRRALEALAPFDDGEVRAIINHAYQDDELTMRASAIYAMGYTCDERWEETILKELHSPEPELRFEAARAAGELESQKAVPRLVAMIGDPDVEVRLQAISALGQIGGKQAQIAVEAALRSPNEAIQAAAEEALDEIRFNTQPLIPAEMLTSKKKAKDQKD